MATKILPANDAGVAEAASLIRQGGLVAYPTDTVYGLGAHAHQPEAIARVFRAKDRPPDRPLPLLLASGDDLTSVATAIPIGAWRLAAVFWPGALTLVLRRASSVPAVISAGGETVAVRVPDHPLTLALIRSLRAPIAGTSANLSGHPAPVIAKTVIEQLGGRIEAVLDGGRCPGGVESTVLDLSGDRPRLVRAGAIDRGEIEDVLELPIE